MRGTKVMNVWRRSLFAAALACASVSASAQTYVPDESTAIAIAEAVSRAMLGNALLAKVKPFTASLHNGEWWVVSAPNLRPDDCRQCAGRAVMVRIDRVSGAIMDWSTVH